MGDKAISRNFSNCVTPNGELQPVFSELQGILSTNPKFQKLRACDDSFTLFEELALHYSKLALLDLNLSPFLRAGAESEALIAAGNVIPQQTALFLHILHALKRSDVLLLTTKNVFRWEDLRTRGEILHQINLLSVEIREKYPLNVVNLELLMQCGPELGSVMCGVTEPLESLFPPDADVTGKTSAAQLYRDAPDSLLAQKLIFKFFKSLQVSGELKILEIGAGTGSYTTAILKALKKRNLEFKLTFTDITYYFLPKAKKKFVEFGNQMEFRLLNIEQSPQSQGFPLGYYDVVIAGNVLHATANLTTTMANVRSLLKDDGILILGELIKQSLSLELSFGMTSGWWRFKGNDELRQDYPLLTAPEWIKLLQNSGFYKCNFLDLRHSLIVAQSIPHEAEE